MTDTTKDINKRTSASIETKIELKRTQEAEIYKTTVTNKKINIVKINKITTRRILWSILQTLWNLQLFLLK
jgi:hypothetical protein